MRSARLQAPQPSSQNVAPMSLASVSGSNSLSPFFLAGVGLYPTEEIINVLTNEDLLELVQSDWPNFLADNESINIAFKPREDVSRRYFHYQPVKIFQITENGKDPSLDRNVTSVIFISGNRGTYLGFRCINYGIPTINYLQSGARLWIIIKKIDNRAFERHVAIIGKRKTCHGCLTRSTLMSPWSLSVHGIRYDVIIQRKKTSVIIDEGTYSAWINICDNTAAVTVRLATQNWFEFAKRNEATRCKCRRAFQLDLDQMEAYNRIICHISIEDTEKPSKKKDLNREKPVGAFECSSHAEEFFQ